MFFLSNWKVGGSFWFGKKLCLLSDLLFARCCFAAPFFLGGFKGSTGVFHWKTKTPSETLCGQAGAPAGLGEPSGGGQGELYEKGWNLCI